MFIVCNQIMLNLFIGMILDNFSFITDDVAQEEDDNWATGSSAEQIQELSNIFMRHDKQTGFVSLNALHTILCEMPQPLGFKDLKGNLQIGGPEKAAELLIRSEINVHIRTARNDKENHDKMTFSRWLAKKLGCEQRLINLKTRAKDNIFSCQVIRLTLPQASNFTLKILRCHRALSRRRADFILASASLSSSCYRLLLVRYCARR